VRPRFVLPVLLAAAVGAVLLAVPGTRSLLAPRAPAATPSAVPPRRPVHVAGQPPPPGPVLRAPAGPLAVPQTWFFGWALLDRGSGTVAGSDNRDTGANTTESMIKPWLAADYLRRAGTAGRRPSQQELGELATMIIRSDDTAAEKYYRLGGATAVIDRLVTLCGLTHTSAYDYWWSLTSMSPADSVRMGQCLADGTAAGPQWTGWLLDTMRHVTGTVSDQQVSTGGGRWGIVDGLPPVLAGDLALKNGWTRTGADGLWHVNCLGISSKWILSVMLRYPIARGLQYGAGICAAVTRQLLYTPDI